MNITNTYIIVNLQIEGIHHWAKLQQHPDYKTTLYKVGYLKDLHRHIFHIRIKKLVTHSDRDIEIILFKRKIIKWFNDSFFDKEYDCCVFYSMSCEHIAAAVLANFEAAEVQVLEDNENGAVVEAI